MLSFTLLVPTVIFLVLGAVVYGKGEVLAEFFPQGELIRDFVSLAFWIAVFSAFFEVFFGYAQAHMRSTEGVFLREMFYRIATTVLLFAVHFGWIGEIQFCYWITASFALRMLLMAWVAYRCRPFRLRWPSVRKYRKIISYGLFSSMGMAIWAALLEFDKSILPFYESLTTEAYYTIAVFIGMTVAVPYRSLYQIANPVLAKAIAEKDTARQEDLSCKSSMNSLILCGGLFLLINCNIHDIFRLRRDVVNPQDQRHQQPLRGGGERGVDHQPGQAVRFDLGFGGVFYRLLPVFSLGLGLFLLPDGFGDRFQPLFYPSLGNE